MAGDGGVTDRTQVIERVGQVERPGGIKRRVTVTSVPVRETG